MKKLTYSAFCIIVITACTKIYLKQRGSPLTSEKQRQRQPHILFILADDLGWYDVGKFVKFTDEV